EFLGRVRMILDAKVDVAVAGSAVAALVPHDEERGALPAAGIAARIFPGLERGDEPVREFAALGLLRGLVGLGHGIDDLLAREDVALHREIFPRAASGKGEAGLASESRAPALRIHDAALSRVAALIGVGEQLDDLLRVVAVLQQLQALWSVGDI